MEPPYTLIKKLSWWDSPLTIKGRNAGVLNIIAKFDDETLPVVDFLNNSLQVEYRAAYDDILTKYEDLLPSRCIFDYTYPEIKDTYQPINTSAYEGEDFPNDTALVDALFKNYETNHTAMRQNIDQWDKKMEAWYAAIKDNPDKTKTT
jgi:hypothetical protein